MLQGQCAHYLSQSLWSQCGSDLRPLRVCEQYRRGSGGSPKGCSSGEAKGAARFLRKPPAQLLSHCSKKRQRGRTLRMKSALNGFTIKGYLLYITALASFKKKNYLLIFREQGERHVNLLFHLRYLCIHWLLLVCALTRDGTHDPGVSGRCPNQVSCLARAALSAFIAQVPKEDTTVCSPVQRSSFLLRFKGLTQENSCL